MIKIAIWGAGKNLILVYDSLDYRKCEIVGIIDSNKEKQNTSWYDIEIKEPDYIKSLEYDYLIISPFKTKEIETICTDYQISKEKIILFWNNKKNYDFLKDYPRENYYLNKENEIIKLKNENLVYELGLKNIPRIYKPEDVLLKILKDNSSLCRFGDGEFEMIRLNERPWFQKSSKALSNRLKEVLNSNDNRINIAIANLYGSLEKYTEEAALAMRKYLSNGTREVITGLLDLNRIYFDAYISRPYLIYKNKDSCGKIFDLWKAIIKNRRLLILEGANSRFGVNNDFISGAKSVRRVLCPAQNAFDVYDKILDTVLKFVQNDELVLITLGPTATVLTYDIAKAGYQAIDIGQVDNEYDWYLRKAEKQIAIEGKCVAEALVGRVPQDEIDLEQYRSEIIAVIEG